MIIVFDIGGTNMRVAGSADDQTLQEVMVFPTPQDYAAGLDLLCEQIQAAAGDEKITAIAGGVPALLSSDKTVIAGAANLPDWSGKTLAADLQQRLGCRVALENDAVIGGIGEAVYGAGKNVNSVAYITIGTGIGGALIINKQPAETGYSFDPGHHIIDVNGPPCPSDGGKGHWESYIRREDFPQYLAIGLYNTTLFWPADVIILGGGVSAKSRWDLQQIAADIQNLANNGAVIPQLHLAAAGDSSGLLGALHLAKQII